ncbi:MAG TPA: hypothetical protein VES73_13215, partial [Lamprocystis sp. (in: g-proteobacteria)]|nr:hypothetical protein [Lamprocystis sp. (in: g-proteobacteria)]
MTWRKIKELETFLLNDTRERWPELIPLARILSLAPRIEPLLLRNARVEFLPQGGAELESQLWFCPLVAARSTREIVLHLGIASVLAAELPGAWGQPADTVFTGDQAPTAPGLQAVWEFTREHTRHWPADDRLERDLRYHALRADGLELNERLQVILAQLAREDLDDDRRIALARLVKRTLPGIHERIGDRAHETARLLARYAALALGDAGDWSAVAGHPDALPAWLQGRLPPPLGRAGLGVVLRSDHPQQLVLQLVEAPADSGLAGDAGVPVIDLPSPLPGRLHVAPDGEAGRWHPVNRGTCIEVDPARRVLRLSTLDGRQWDLINEARPAVTGPGPDHDGRRPPLRLIHVPADHAQAAAIAAWLRRQGVAVDLVVESFPDGESDPRRAPDSSEPARALRLWTHAARALWNEIQGEPSPDQDQTLLLRIEDVDPPAVGAAMGRLLNWPGWQQLGDSNEAAALFKKISAWWETGEIDETEPVGPEGRTPTVGPEPTTPAEPPPTDETDETAGVVGAKTKLEGKPDRETQIADLLARIADPRTTPPERLAIGDQLAELGDPRPGVGTITIKVPIDQAPSDPPQVQALIEEIANPETIPPRRLEIGD